MSSILIATVPFHGHVTPLLTVARHLTGRGDRVRFLTGARFADVGAATGAEHVPLPPEADFDDRQDWDAVFPERGGLTGTRAIAHDIEHIFIRPGRPQHDAIMDLLATEPADAILTDPALTGGGFLLGHPLGARPPVVMCGIAPLMISSRDTAPFGLGLTPLGGPLGRLRNAALAMITRRIVLPGVERIADQAYAEVHHRPIPFAVLDWPRHADAIVQFTVPEFEFPRSDAPATLHFAGPISASGSAAPLPPWWPDLDGPRPVVHLTQGTLANVDFGQLITQASRAWPTRRS
jgi:UDP:flavonoid glycosyltransferase YjiC (YdhE family)